MGEMYNFSQEGEDAVMKNCPKACNLCQAPCYFETTYRQCETRAGTCTWNKDAEKCEDHKEEMTCGEVKKMYKMNNCCGNPGKQFSTGNPRRLEDSENTRQGSGTSPKDPECCT